MEHSVQAYLKRLSTEKLEKFLQSYESNLQNKDFSGMIDAVTQELEWRKKNSPRESTGGLYLVLKAKHVYDILLINPKEEVQGIMNFTEIAENRQSCRKYDATRMVESEKLDRILESARLAPSACNGQPYQITVCKGESAKQVAKATQAMGMNKFASDAPILIVLSEMPYVASAAFGARMKKNDYRSIDIGILAAYITAEATAQGLGTCILGWLDDPKIREICGLDGAVRLVITLGYPLDPQRTKKRKELPELVKTMEV